MPRKGNKRLGGRDDDDERASVASGSQTRRGGSPDPADEEEEPRDEVEYQPLPLCTAAAMRCSAHPPLPSQMNPCMGTKLTARAIAGMSAAPAPLELQACGAESFRAR